MLIISGPVYVHPRLLIPESGSSLLSLLLESTHLDICIFAFFSGFIKNFSCGTFRAFISKINRIEVSGVEIAEFNFDTSLTLS